MKTFRFFPFLSFVSSTIVLVGKPNFVLIFTDNQGKPKGGPAGMDLDAAIEAEARPVWKKS
jgi:hypothetical protein